MNARLDHRGSHVSGQVAKHLFAASRAIAESPLPETVRHLVEIRASQINGCAFCIDMHTKDATKAGESPVRLHLVAGWREATVFTDAERAALELAEEGTRIADAAGGVGDEVWAAAAEHFDAEQLAALTAQIAVINAWNRLNVITRQPGGDYQA
ncbi:alkylhydroperoxidase [Actinoplanes sp. SE50]|uniref:carboxymuconolactone decarboxylase family protein n=1 Tax=unclassified Actinoplanes TaxID=2626549 RepID=UPI00023EC269|nr:MULTISPECIES: carboxymuconolactone decarboxylase family protein [unclassified Actinoplanes]AEV83571.1 ydfG-like uncharacterized protein [Actinoplanes sp. SE50/110]ATO82285.1 alkylhydroperoxidase [Actinoplanes sp. SE50]SLL99692.1 alkylhydroperoxidase [Actinoplanes sp. SE50/110]